MLLEAEERLEDLVVRLLGLSEPMPVEALARRIYNETGRRYSVQGIYKVLRSLQRTGVVVRARKRYGLSMPWVVKLLDFARALEERQLEGRPVGDLIPAKGASQSWIFYDLLRMDDFWNHLVISLLRLTKAGRMFEWAPHPWFDLLAPDKEREFANALRLGGNRFYMIVGGRTPLDIACSKLWPRETFVTSLERSPWEGQRTLYLDVIGDYLITIRLQERTAREIDQLFSGVESRADLELRKVFAVLTRKCRIRLTLAHDERKAKQLRSRFARVFGCDPS